MIQLNMSGEARGASPVGRTMFKFFVLLIGLGGISASLVAVPGTGGTLVMVENVNFRMDGPGTVVVFDAEGKVILEAGVAGNEGSIAILTDGLPPGSYLVQLRSSSRLLDQQRIRLE